MESMRHANDLSDNFSFVEEMNYGTISMCIGVFSITTKKRLRQESSFLLLGAPTRRDLKLLLYLAQALYRSYQSTKWNMPNLTHFLLLF